MTAKSHFASRGLLAAYVLVVAPWAQAQAATPCSGTDAGALVLGTAARVDPGAGRRFAVTLAEGQGIVADLVLLTPSAAAGGEEDGEGEGAKTLPRNLVLCDAHGAQLAPLAGEVFAKGNTVSSLPDGQRLRFIAPSPGVYSLGVTGSVEPREIIVRERVLGKVGGVAQTGLGRTETGKVSSVMPQLFAFAATAGQWVELKSVSENDTVLHLAGPDRKGDYAEIASNDDSDGLNPLIRRRLPVTATYYLQVDSLGDEVKDFTLTLASIAAPPPSPAPAVLRAGATARDRLAGENDARLYVLPVVAGHSYRLELNAPYDGVVAIGLPNPVEAEDGDNGPGAEFAEIKSQDSGTTGSERLTFTARQAGQLLVRVRSFGIGETDGGYALEVSDLGG